MSKEEYIPTHNVFGSLQNDGTWLGLDKRRIPDDWVMVKEHTITNSTHRQPHPANIKTNRSPLKGNWGWLLG